jgi:IMP dehydrogenase
MRFLNDVLPTLDLTYSDVFMVPQKSDILSRFEVNLETPDNIGTHIPIVVSNMNAVAGKRMAETVARRGGLVVLPQDIPLDLLKKNINYIKNASNFFETPVMLGPDDTIAKALDLIHKRSHKAVIVVDENQKPIGIFTEKDAEGLDRFTRLHKVMSKSVITLEEKLSAEEAFLKLETHRVFMAPVVNKHGAVIGALTQKGALRSDLYKPAVDKQGRLLVAAAIGINGDAAKRARDLLDMGVDIIVIDTAHGHQQKMLDCIKTVRSEVGKEIIIVAGNVATAEATVDLIKAGANIVKVGIGPGAMCTTRMMTGVGRPQFSAVLESSIAAKKLGATVWADGGVRHPRDVALALAAGASNVMFGSWFAGTHESAADTLQDADGRLYKENYGMASRRAVRGRTENDTIYERAKKELFEEGISASRLYLDPANPGVEDIIDKIIAGVRSSLTYSGARNISEFQKKATIGIQTSAGYSEGLPVPASW